MMNKKENIIMKREGGEDKKENAIQACANAFKKSFLQKSWKYGKVKLLGDAEIVKQATGQQAIINSSNNELETAQIPLRCS